MKEQSGELIGTVFINDDCSTGDLAEKYRGDAATRYF